MHSKYLVLKELELVNSQPKNRRDLYFVASYEVDPKCIFSGFCQVLLVIMTDY